MCSNTVQATETPLPLTDAKGAVVFPGRRAVQVQVPFQSARS